MSLAYNQTSSPYKGLVQFYEKGIGANYGDVSGNAEKLGEFTARVCTALDDYLLIWAKNAGTWQADDLNFTGEFGIITFNITSGRRDYTVTVDEDSNRIIDVSKVLILPSATATDYIELSPIDELNTGSSQILVNSNTGTPYQYGKMGPAVFLDPIPDYSVAAGVKMVVNREGSYPTTAWTTQFIGVPVFHDYFYKKPAYEYAKIHNLANVRELEKDVIDLEGSERLGITGKIADFFAHRERDVRKVMTHNGRSMIRNQIGL